MLNRGKIDLSKGRSNKNESMIPQNPTKSQNTITASQVLSIMGRRCLGHRKPTNTGCYARAVRSRVWPHMRDVVAGPVV